MENERNKAENEAKLKELETRLNEKIARAEKLEKSLKNAQKENYESHRHHRVPGSRLLTKLIIFLALFIVLIFMGTMAYLYFSEKIAEDSFQAKSALVSRELVQCAELSTVKMNYSDVVSIKKNFWGLSKSYTIIKYKAVARAGIEDVAKIKTEISKDLNTIKIEMPTCTLLSNDISSFEVFDESGNIFVPIETAEILAEIEKSRDIASITLLNDGLIDEANNHAKSILTQVFSAMGFTFVDIQIYDPLDSTTSMGENLENNVVPPITSVPKGSH